MDKTRIRPAETTSLLIKFTSYYFLITLASLGVSRLSGEMVNLWFANAFALVFLIFSSKKNSIALLGCVALAILIAHLALGDTLQHAFTVIPAHLLELAIAAYLIHRTNSAEKFSEDPENLIRFLFFAIFIPCLVGATVADGISIGMPSYSWWSWFAGIAIATLGSLPFAMLLMRMGWRALFQRIHFQQSLPWVAAIICINIFSLMRLPYPFIYVLAPLTIAAVIVNFEMMTMLVCLSTIVSGTTIAIGRFVSDHLADGTVWQIYLPFSLTIMSPLIMAVGMNQGRLRDEARRKAELALEQSTQDLRTIIDHTPAMIGYWDKDLKNRFGNRAYGEWFGVTQEQMHDRHIREIIGEERYAKNLPYIEAALRGESPVFERSITDRSGTSRHVLASYVPDIVEGETKGFYAFVNDITSLVNAQREQSVAQTQLQSVIDAASEFSIIATALDGTIKVFSAGAERMLGYRASEIVDKTTPLILHLSEEIAARKKELKLDMAISEFAVFTAKIAENQADVHEWTYRRKDGSCLPIRLVVTAMHDENGAVSGYLGIAKDISQQRMLQISLVKAKEQAEAASHAKSEFVANMSHEIRTPLNAVLGMAHLLANTSLSNEQRDYLGMIQVSGSSLLGIINDILDFSKIEAGRMDMVFEPFSLSDVLSAVANIMMVNAGEKDLELAVGVTPGVPPKLIGDALHLQQVLINLVSNAIKFTEYGEVSLLVECDGVSSDNWMNVRFIVNDTGIGIEKEQQEKVFSAFSQADSSTTRRFGGTGLGLAICKRLVALMKGTIQLQSKLGVGSKFEITLPMQVVSENLNRTDVWNKKIRLLVIDDNATSREYLCQTIRSLDWYVDNAATGADGIALVVSNHQNPYDLILIDWQMPDTDSCTIMQILRASAMSGKSQAHIVIMASTFGRGKLIGDRRVTLADTILVKPVMGENLLALMNQGGETIHKERERLMPFEQLQRKWHHRIKGIHILLVEDNQLNQVVARGMLMQAGAMVDVLDNGLKAVERMSAATHYDIILMDVQMPVMDGCTATKKIREELQLNIPILAMTAGVMESERELCTASGMNDFIGKPIDVEQMFTTIVRYLPVGKGSEPHIAAIQETAESNLEDQSNLIFNPEPVLQVGKDDAAYRKRMLDLIRQAVQQSPLLFIEARQAWQSGNIKEAEKILHGMRSSLGMLGAKQFSTATAAIERALQTEELDAALSLFDVAGRSLETTLQEARLWLEHQST